MLLSLDVHYGSHGSATGAVAFPAWDAAAPAFELVLRSDVPPLTYEPGRFYVRELPYLLEAVAAVEQRAAVESIVVDGYVWLGEDRPGLGAHLHQALGGRCAVVGVAKTEFTGAQAVLVRRGSVRPLYVTAAGMDPARAAELVRGMHGPFRVPTLLRRTDQLARGLVAVSS